MVTNCIPQCLQAGGGGGEIKHKTMNVQLYTDDAIIESEKNETSIVISTKRIISKKYL